ncbi:MAG: DUF5777 family beta-barrel protein [Bacteroidota bacterium]
MKSIFTTAILLFSVAIYAQDDLMDQLDKETKPAINYTTATFKGTRLMNGQTIETMAAKHMNMWIQHRFGRVNSGFEGFWGLDESRVRIGFDYGLTDNLMIGIGRSSFQKTADYFAKYKLLRQSKGTKFMPFTATLLAGGAINAMPTGYPTELGTTMKFNNNTERQSYFGQLILARKFNESVSLQLMPTFLHNNKTESAEVENDVMAMGIGGRIKLSKRISLNAEYYAVVRDYENETYPYKNSLAVGVDIETGGHVFQLHFTNSRGMIEKQFITGTTGEWGNGDIHYGFNISRVFSFDPKTKKKK